MLKLFCLNLCSCNKNLDDNHCPEDGIQFKNEKEEDSSFFAVEYGSCITSVNGGNRLRKPANSDASVWNIASIEVRAQFLVNHSTSESKFESLDESIKNNLKYTEVKRFCKPSETSIARTIDYNFRPATIYTKKIHGNRRSRIPIFLQKKSKIYPLENELVSVSNYKNIFGSRLGKLDFRNLAENNSDWKTSQDKSLKFVSKSEKYIANRMWALHKLQILTEQEEANTSSKNYPMPIAKKEKHRNSNNIDMGDWFKPVSKKMKKKSNVVRNFIVTDLGKSKKIHQIMKWFKKKRDIHLYNKHERIVERMEILKGLDGLNRHSSLPLKKFYLRRFRVG